MQQVKRRPASSDTRRVPGIARLDAHGNVREAMGDIHDPALHEFLQTEDDPPGSIDSAVGRSLEQLVEPGPELDAALYSLRIGCPARLRTARHGREFELTLAPYRNPEGQVLGALCIVREPGRATHRICDRGPIRALIVDDDHDSRALERSHLSKALARCGGAEIREAAHGVEALQILSGFLPDLIMLDLHMPVMDGRTLLRALRLDPRYNRIPVIAITANEPTDAERSRIENDTYGLMRMSGDLAAQLEAAISRVVADDFVAPEL